jgi:hypothetical protein
VSNGNTFGGASAPASDFDDKASDKKKLEREIARQRRVNERKAMKVSGIQV